MISERTVAQTEEHQRSKDLWCRCFDRVPTRISRSTYWKAGLLLTGINLLLFLICIIGIGGVIGIPIGTILLIPGQLYLLLCWIIIGMKRLHDINLSGWWVFIGLVPCLGILVLFILLGLVKGTVGTNRFGPPDTGKTAIRTETTLNR